MTMTQSQLDISYLESINSILLNYCTYHNLPTISVRGFQNGYKKDKSICLAECEIHGDGMLFGNPWFPRLNHLRRSKNLEVKNISGCPKCKGNYRYTELEYRDLITNALEQTNCTLIDFFTYGKVNINMQTECLLNCSVHGDLFEFSKEVRPKIQKILHRKLHCPKCTNGYRYSPEEVLEQIKERFVRDSPQITVKGFAESFHGKSTRVLLYCSKHGNFYDWSRPSTPTVESILSKNGCGCVKCKKQFYPDALEASKQIHHALKSTPLSFIEFGEKYHGRKTSCKLLCEHHPYIPYNSNIDHIVNSQLKGCPKCIKDGHHLRACIKNISSRFAPRTLYYVEIRKNNNDQFVAYKIGLSHRTLHQRFPRGTLEKRNLKISYISSIELPNIIAAITEVFVLAKFHQKLNYPKSMHNWGKTECFEGDALGIREGGKLQDYVEMALSQCKSILNLFTTVKSANKLTREVLKLSVFNAVHSEEGLVDIANLKKIIQHKSQRY
jgi:hypothetical protein